MVVEKANNNLILWITISIGAVMVLIGFAGCWGAAKESRCCLGTVKIAQKLTRYLLAYLIYPLQYATFAGLLIILTIVAIVLLNQQGKLDQRQMVTLIVVGVVQVLAALSSLGLCFIIRHSSSSSYYYY